MPTTDICGRPGEANKTIGGVPTVHYLDFASKGRGQVVRLFFEDAGIAYEDVRYPDDELPEAKTTVLRKMNPASTLPILELNGKILTQSYALLRHFSRILDQYDGKTEDEKYWVDAICDLAADWRNVFVFAFFNTDKDAYAKHEQGDRVRYLDALETQLRGNKLYAGGPFVLGNRLTYADMVVYQVCHDEGLTKDAQRGLSKHPGLGQLVDALESRPNIKAFLHSNRYRG